MLEEKEFLRKKFLQRRENLSPSFIQKESVIVSGELLKFLSACTYKNIVFYFPIKGEVDLRKAMVSLFQKSDIHIFLPRFDLSQNQYCFSKIENLDTDLVLGKYNVMEPKSNLATISIQQAQTLIDIWIVPGIVFDLKGYRIGFGKGYYDLFLKSVKGLKIGIGYDWQFLETVPHSATDVSMNYMFSGTKILKF